MELRTKSLQQVCFLLALLMALAGCKGGSGSPSSANQDGAPRPLPVPPSPSTANSPPSITGQPDGTVLVNERYTFQPAVSDPDGDSLTFTAEGLPDWLSLDSSTGRLSGTPTSADVGSYQGIVITVSDQRATDTLGPFSITVTEVGGGVATLSWQPPTENEDGTPLTDLTGYEIRYGRSPDDLDTTISLSNPSLSVYVVENLSSGTWYFAVSSVNSRGVTSALSNIASKTIS